MKKEVRTFYIQCCAECRYFDEDTWKCEHPSVWDLMEKDAKFNRSTNKWEIPEWCPLEDG